MFLADIISNEPRWCYLQELGEVAVGTPPNYVGYIRSDPHQLYASNLLVVKIYCY